MPFVSSNSTSYSTADNHLLHIDATLPLPSNGWGGLIQAAESPSPSPRSFPSPSNDAEITPPTTLSETSLLRSASSDVKKPRKQAINVFFFYKSHATTLFSARYHGGLRYGVAAKVVAGVWKRLPRGVKETWKMRLKDARRQCEAVGQKLEGQLQDYLVQGLSPEEIVPEHLLQEVCAKLCTEGYPRATSTTDAADMVKAAGKVPAQQKRKAQYNDAAAAVAANIVQSGRKYGNPRANDGSSDRRSKRARRLSPSLSSSSGSSDSYPHTTPEPPASHDSPEELFDIAALEKLVASMQPAMTNNDVNLVDDVVPDDIYNPNSSVNASQHVAFQGVENAFDGYAPLPGYAEIKSGFSHPFHNLPRSVQHVPRNGYVFGTPGFEFAFDYHATLPNQYPQIEHERFSFDVAPAYEYSSSWTAMREVPYARSQPLVTLYNTHAHPVPQTGFGTSSYTQDMIGTYSISDVVPHDHAFVSYHCSQQAGRSSCR